MLMLCISVFAPFLANVQLLFKALNAIVMKSPFVCICIVLMSFTNATTGIETNKNSLTDKDRNNSILFKASRNSNRLAVVDQLLPLIKSKQQIAAARQINVKPTTFTELVALLGQPDIKINNGLMVYTLNPAIGCKLLVGVDATNTIDFFIKKDCN